MNKKKIIIITIIIIIICIIGFISFKTFKKQIKQNKIKNATIIVELNNNLESPLYKKTKVSDYITNINGEIIDDYYINTNEIGKQKIEFEYINDEDIKIKYDYEIEIKDVTPPVIWLGSTYTINQTPEDTLLEDILCGDDYDSTPKCEIIGEYDTNKLGSYNLTFQATDSSNNITTKEFTLNVVKPSNSGYGYNKQTTIEEFITNYKNDNTKIGIDVSGWQGEIDFQKVKDSGVEFVIIKVGGTKGIGGDYYVDSKFIRNIEGFSEIGMPIGIYFYSFANNEEQTKKDAEWVLEQIKPYNIELGVAYDWENWWNYNTYKNSFYELTNNANIFLDIMKENGYETYLYGSKNYLEKIWLPTEHKIWLAHYADSTNYQGNYKYWQLSSTGSVPGISGNVDIDIMYLDK